MIKCIEELVEIITPQLEPVTSKYPELTAELIIAVISQESGYEVYAQRHEPTFQYIDMRLPRPKQCPDSLERYCQHCSYGLTQVMLVTAREHGFDGWPGELFDPETNIKYGIDELIEKYDRYFEKYGIEGVLAAYNAGNIRKNADGSFVNQHYVTRVLNAIVRINQTLGDNTKESYPPKTEGSTPKSGQSGSPDTTPGPDGGSSGSGSSSDSGSETGTNPDTGTGTVTETKTSSETGSDMTSGTDPNNPPAPDEIGKDKKDSQETGEKASNEKGSQGSSTHTAAAPAKGKKGKA